MLPEAGSGESTSKRALRLSFANALPISDLREQSLHTFCLILTEQVIVESLTSIAVATGASLYQQDEWMDTNHHMLCENKPTCLQRLVEACKVLANLHLRARLPADSPDPAC